MVKTTTGRAKLPVHQERAGGTPRSTPVLGFMYPGEKEEGIFTCRVDKKIHGLTHSPGMNQCTHTVALAAEMSPLFSLSSGTCFTLR